MFKYSDYAYMIYKEKSFTKAAEKLFISQPSLSLTIKKLESELGAPVFDRSGKEICLTEIGQKFIAAVEEIKGIEKNLKNEIDDLQKLKKGKMTIGSTIFVSSNILPNILKKFQADFPQIDINIMVEHSSTLEKMLEKGSVDFIVDNALKENRNEYEYIPVTKEHILLAVPNNIQKSNDLCITSDVINTQENWHKNAKKININQFTDDKFILLKTGNNMRQISNRIFKENNVTPNVVQEFDHLMTSVSYAEAGFGICFITDLVLKHTKVARNMSLYMPDTNHSERMLYVIRKKNRYHSYAEKEIIKYIEKFSKQYTV